MRKENLEETSEVGKSSGAKGYGLFFSAKASRAEVYGLFLAAILILGGGTGAAVAVAINANETSPPSSESADAPTSSPSSSEEPTSPPASSEEPTASPSSSGESTSTPTSTPSNTASSNDTPTSTPSSSPSSTPSSSASTTSCQSAYWNSVRADKQNRVNWLQSNVTMYSNGVKHNQDQLTALRNGLPTEIVSVQTSDARTGITRVYELSGSELEEFLEDRLRMNSDPLVRAQQDLDQAVAELNSVPNC